MYKSLTILNTVIIIGVAILVIKGSLPDEKSVNEVSELQLLKEENQILQQNLQGLRTELSELWFELSRDSEMSASPALPELTTSQALTDRDAEAAEDEGVWSGVDEVETSYVSFGEGYDTENTAVDWNAMRERECHASGKGLIGLFAAMTAKCPDWYFGDAIIITD